MSTIHPRFWDIAYAVILVIAIPVAIFHAAQDRWAQAVLVTLAAAGGAVILVTGWNRTEPVPEPARDIGERSDDSRAPQPSRIEMERQREPGGRYVGWLSMGAVSGFVATGIMTAAVLAGYGISAVLGATGAGASQLQVWFANLIDNTVTEIATVNLAAAIGLHLVAGIGWAIIFAGFVEPRLSGSGLQRGVIFGLLPFAFSVTIFFWVVGAGFLGTNIGAGPLPVLGNLILHLIYGGALGKIYSSHAVWQEPVADVSSQNIQVLELAHRGMAVGLIPGAIFGLMVSVVFTSAFTPETDLVMAGVLGAVVGSAVGVWIGSLAGLSPGAAENHDNASA